MSIWRVIASVVLGLGVCVCADAAQSAAGPSGISISPDLLELLRAEMRELLGGSQAIGLALPVGDWARITAVGEQMRKSYILEKKLTKAQREELEGLPEQFRVLDQQLHLRAEKLAHAASVKDVELTSFHYGRLLENCASCHAAYAQQRFPGFSGPAAEPHHH